jgi:hypothetical protein
MTKVTKNKTIQHPLLEDEQLFFLHIPKCAGMTFIGIMDSHFTQGEICPVHRFFKHLKEQIPKEELATYKYIRGHFPYDLVYLLPRKPRLITFLRHPVARTLSALEMLQDLGDRGVGVDPSKNIQFKGVDLDELFNRPDLIKRIANRSTAYLSGNFGQPDLDLAKERLATFDFIGITEDFDESLELFAYVFDFSPIFDYKSRNVSPNRAKRHQIPQSKLDMLAELNQLDVELYEYGLQLYQEKRAIMIAEMKSKGSIPKIKSAVKPQLVYFDFRRVDPGTGWYQAEISKELGITRWSGPGTVSSLRIPVPSDHHQMIRFRIVNALSMEVVESLKLKVNGIDIPIKRSPDGGGMKYLFEGQIPRKVLKRNPRHTQVTFEVDKTLSPDQDNRADALKMLGLCYHWLQVYPR